VSIIFINSQETQPRNYAIPKGKTVLLSDEDCYIRFNGFSGGVQIHINGTGVASYMLGTTLYPDEEILDDTTNYVDLEEEDITDIDRDFSLYPGPHCIRIQNRSTSTDSIDVLWSFTK
jgi:hypothetical protein